MIRSIGAPDGACRSRSRGGLDLRDDAAAGIRARLEARIESLPSGPNAIGRRHLRPP